MTTALVITDEMIARFVEISKKELVITFDDLKFSLDDVSKQQQFNGFLRSFEPSDKAKVELDKYGVGAI